MTAPRKAATAKRSGTPPHKAAGKSSTPRKMQKQANVRVVRTKRIAPEQSPSVAPARQSKKAAVIALLGRPEGAAISDLIGVTGRQVHSVRAALTGLRKEGKELSVPRTPPESRITASSPRRKMSQLDVEIAALQGAATHDLRIAWRRLYRGEPPRCMIRELMIRAIAYRMQEQVHGRLAPATKRRLHSLVAAARTRSSRHPQQALDEHSRSTLGRQADCQRLAVPDAAEPDLPGRDRP